MNEKIIYNHLSRANPLICRVKNKGLKANVTIKRSTAWLTCWSMRQYRACQSSNCLQCFWWHQMLPALLYGLLEPLCKHLQVCIPHQQGERWEPRLWINKNADFFLSLDLCAPQKTEDDEETGLSAAFSLNTASQRWSLVQEQIVYVGEGKYNGWVIFALNCTPGLVPVFNLWRKEQKLEAALLHPSHCG